MASDADALHRIADSFGPAASRWRKIRDIHYYADRLAELEAALEQMQSFLHVREFTETHIDVAERIIANALKARREKNNE